MALTENSFSQSTKTILEFDMAKMLGQDIVTQEEFETFKADHHDPLATIITDVASAHNDSFKLVKYALILSAVSLLGTLGLAFLIVMH